MISYQDLEYMQKQAKVENDLLLDNIINLTERIQKLEMKVNRLVQHEEL